MYIFVLRYRDMQSYLTIIVILVLFVFYSTFWLRNKHIVYCLLISAGYTEVARYKCPITILYAQPHRTPRKFVNIIEAELPVVDILRDATRYTRLYTSHKIDDEYNKSGYTSNYIDPLM